MSHRREIPITERHVLKKYTNKFRAQLKFAPKAGGRALELTGWLTGDHWRRTMSHRKEIPITERHVLKKKKYPNSFRDLLKLNPRKGACLGGPGPDKTAD